MDVRDDDRMGGHPVTSVHFPASEFDADSVISSKLMPKLQQGISKKSPSVVVVLFCMESARRGPRCARRLVEKLQEQVIRTSSVSVHVMKGGADQWIRRFITEDPELVEGFDNDYWGWLPGDRANSPSGSVRLGNRLYTRPDEQPATPWSGGGSKAPS